MTRIQVLEVDTCPRPGAPETRESIFGISAQIRTDFFLLCSWPGASRHVGRGGVSGKEKKGWIGSTRTNISPCVSLDSSANFDISQHTGWAQGNLEL